MRFPIIRQLEHKDCGATCIQMITQYYGNKVPMSVIKNLCEVTRIGLSVFDLTECMKKLGFAVTASTISFDFVTYNNILETRTLRGSLQDCSESRETFFLYS